MFEWHNITLTSPSADGSYLCVTTTGKPAIGYYCTKNKSWTFYTHGVFVLDSSCLKKFYTENISDKIFKPGDRVKVMTGKYIERYRGGWVDEMEKFVDCEFTVRSVPEKGLVNLNLPDGELDWNFDPRGLIKC